MIKTRKSKFNPLLESLSEYHELSFDPDDLEFEWSLRQSIIEGFEEIAKKESTRQKLMESHLGQKVWNKGQRMSADFCQKMSNSHKGQQAWNKNKKGVMPEPWNKNRTGVYSKTTLNKMSLSRKGYVPWNKGILTSEEVKQKISKRNKGKIAWNKGVPQPEEIKKKISESLKGHTPWNKGQKECFSKETLQKMSNSQMGKKGFWLGKERPEITGTKNPFYGKKHSKKSLEIMSKSHIRENLSEFTLQKMSKSQKIRLMTHPHPMKGRKQSEEARRKNGDAHRGQKPNSGCFKKGHTTWIKGKHHSLETLQKLRSRTVSQSTLEKIRLARAKQIMPSHDTKIERVIQIALSIEQIQYKKHKAFKMKSGSYHQVDIFIDPNICIEVDGCYWHSCKQCGFDYPPRVEKDKLINESLRSQGYKVIRIWEHEIKESVDRCVEMIRKEIPLVQKMS